MGSGSVPSSRRGFTLIEAALATCIIGTGVLSMMRLFAACTQENAYSASVTSALCLAGNIQETMAGLPLTDPTVGATHFGPEGGEALALYDDVDDFDGLSVSPPIDAMRRPVPALTNFTQQVSVTPVLPNSLSGSIPTGTYTGAVRVTVRVFHRAGGDPTGTLVYRVSWIRTSD